MPRLTSVSWLALAVGAAATLHGVGSPNLDRRGRPTSVSDLLIDRANRHWAPREDLTGRRRGRAPDVGAYEYDGD